jgi:opacity protein-like surface antigen
LLIAVTGFVFTAPAVSAAEGAAAEPTAETEEEGIAIPGETETEQEVVDILKGTETGYVPAAASSVRKRATQRHWNIHAGLGYAYIGQEDTAIYDDTEVKHELNGDLYPILGVSYAFSTRWALEFSLRRDFYSGEISNSISGSSSKLEGITANLGALFLGGPYGEAWRPYALAGLGYRTLDGELDYPVTSYKPAIGAVLGIGMLKGKWDFRLGYSFFKHDADSTLEGYTGSGDELDTSGIYLEVAYHFL